MSWRKPRLSGRPNPVAPSSTRHAGTMMLKEVKALPIVVAAAYTALGDNDEAFRILEKAVGERSSLVVFLKEAPPLKNLHSDPRWKPLLHRMNFPPE